MVTTFRGATGTALPTAGVIICDIALHPDHQPISWPFHVTPHLAFDGFIGTELLAALDVRMEFRRPRLILSDGTEVPLCRPVPSGVLLAAINEQESGEDEPNLSHLPVKLPDIDDQGLPPDRRLWILDLVQRYGSVFQPANGAEPCNFPPFDVNTGDASPVFRQPYRVPYSERETIEEHVKAYLERGWIRPSQSQWSSPTIIVRKGEKTRFCVDYRALNAITVPDRFPAPDIRDCLDRLSGCSIFTLCDADAAYHQCTVTAAASEKLAFSTHSGLYEPTVVLFGPRNAPAYFQRNIARILQGLPNVFAYLDDIMICTDTWEEHQLALETCFARLAQHNIRLKPSKCVFAQNRVKYLGFIVSKGSIAADPTKLEAVRCYPPPHTPSSLRSFLGMCGYYQHFIPRYAEIASVLYSLTTKDSVFSWTEHHQSAFEQLKSSLMTAGTLSLPDLSRPLEVMCDASTRALGAVLQQRDADTDLPLPIAFASRVLTPTERGYFTQELECLAVVYALDKFRVYLLGRHFKLFTDHQALVSVLRKPSTSPRIERRSLSIQEFDFEIVHIPGRTQLVADALSRATEPVVVGSLMDPAQSWSVHQANDQFCASTISHLEASTETGFAGFELREGILVLRDGACGHRVVVPLSLKEEVLQHVHGSPTSAHQGIKRTLSRCAQDFFWPGWRRDVINHVRSCLSCQERKAPAKEKRPTFHIFSQGFNDLVAMDIQGPLVQTHRGVEYILVIQCLFSKFVVAVPLQDTTAPVVAESFLRSWVMYFGPPARLLTDNGSNFHSGVMEDLYLLFKINKLWTSPYHPQTDGSVERFNRTLNAMLSHFVDVQRQDDWDQFLPLVIFAYNSTYNPSIGTTPFFMVNGFQAPSIVDHLRQVPMAEVSSYGPELRSAMRQALTAAYNAVIRQQQQSRSMQAANNEESDFVQYVTGEEVLIFNPTTPSGLKSKYIRRWVGPFRVLQVTGPLSYVVATLDGTKAYRVHAEHMRRIYKQLGV